MARKRPRPSAGDDSDTENAMKKATPGSRVINLSSVGSRKSLPCSSTTPAVGSASSSTSTTPPSSNPEGRKILDLRLVKASRFSTLPAAPQAASSVSPSVGSSSSNTPSPSPERGNARPRSDTAAARRFIMKHLGGLGLVLQKANNFLKDHGEQAIPEAGTRKHQHRMAVALVRELARQFGIKVVMPDEPDEDVPGGGGDSSGEEGGVEAGPVEEASQTSPGGCGQAGPGADTNGAAATTCAPPADSVASVPATGNGGGLVGKIAAAGTSASLPIAARSPVAAPKGYVPSPVRSVPKSGQKMLGGNKPHARAKAPLGKRPLAAKKTRSAPSNKGAGQTGGVRAGGGLFGQLLGGMYKR